VPSPRRFRPAVELLEHREVPAVMLAPTADLQIPDDRPVYLPVTVTNTPSGMVSTTVTTDTPDVAAEVLTGGRSVRFDVTGRDAANQPFAGALTIRLFENVAPLATGRIVELTTSGFYDGKLFHRVVPNFVIQGGSPNGDGVGGSPLPDVADEFDPAYTFASNGLVAMANGADDNNDSQFFVTDLNLPLAQRAEFLNFNHSIVGILTEGFDTYAAIRDTPKTGERPNTDVVITKATVFDDAENAVVRLTPRTGFTGTARVTVAARDQSAAPPATYTFAARGVTDTSNSRAFLSPVPDLTSPGGDPVTYPLRGTDIDGDPLTFAVQAADAASAASVTVAVDPATGVTMFTPVAGQFGTFHFVAGVRDQVTRSSVSAENFDTEQFTVTVSPRVVLTGPGRPVLVGEAFTLTADVSGPAVTAGTVEFRADGVVLGQSAVVGGRATINTRFDAAGTRTVTARLNSTDPSIPAGDAAPIQVTAVTPPIENPPLPPAPPPVPPSPPVVPPPAPPVVPPPAPPVVPPPAPPVVPPPAPPMLPPVVPPPAPPVVPPTPAPATGGFTATGASFGQAPTVTVTFADGRTQQFAAFEPTFTGGVTVATADVTGDGVPDIVAVPQTGGGGVVKVFDAIGSVLFIKMTFEASFRGGLNLAVGDILGRGYAQIVVGAGPGGGPRVAVFDVPTATTLRDFFAHDPAGRSGVDVRLTTEFPGGPLQLITTGGTAGAVTDPRTGGVLSTFTTSDQSPPPPPAPPTETGQEGEPTEEATPPPAAVRAPAVGMREFLGSTDELALA